MMLTGDDLLSEADIQASVVKAGRDAGWLVYHTKDSRRSEPGFVDLVCVRPPRVIFIEVKRGSGKLIKGHWNKRRTRYLPGQQDWLDALQACPGVETCVVRPADLDAIYAALATKEASHEA